MDKNYLLTLFRKHVKSKFFKEYVIFFLSRKDLSEISDVLNEAAQQSIGDVNSTDESNDDKVLSQFIKYLKVTNFRKTWFIDEYLVKTVDVPQLVTSCWERFEVHIRDFKRKKNRARITRILRDESLKDNKRLIYTVFNKFYIYINKVRNEDNIYYEPRLDKRRDKNKKLIENKILNTLNDGSKRIRIFVIGEIPCYAFSVDARRIMIDENFAYHKRNNYSEWENHEPTDAVSQFSFKKRYVLPIAEHFWTKSVNIFNGEFLIPINHLYHYINLRYTKTSDHKKRPFDTKFNNTPINISYDEKVLPENSDSNALAETDCRLSIEYLVRKHYSNLNENQKNTYIKFVEEKKDNNVNVIPIGLIDQLQASNLINELKLTEVHQEIRSVLVEEGDESDFNDCLIFFHTRLYELLREYIGTVYDQ